MVLVYIRSVNIVLKNLPMAQHETSSWLIVLSLLSIIVSFYGVSCVNLDHGNGYISAVGDSGMRRDGLRVAIEAWNQCNEVGEEVTKMGSPRVADCFDVYKASPQSQGKLNSMF